MNPWFHMTNPWSRMTESRATHEGLIFRPYIIRFINGECCQINLQYLTILATGQDLDYDIILLYGEEANHLSVAHRQKSSFFLNDIILHTLRLLYFD